MRTTRRSPFVCLLLLVAPLTAQSPAPEPSDYEGALRWRFVGPSRGGRVAAVCGVRGEPGTAYMGAAGGGVFKTIDGGASWTNVSDGFFGGSIGAVAVAPSDRNVVFVGGGEKTVRGNVSHGDGVWRSRDAGRTWEHVGLADTHHVPRIVIHPRDPDRVFVAALGHLHGDNDERGVFKTTDGGRTWQNVLSVGRDVGVVDLCMAPQDPRVLFATTWRARRSPHGFTSGGDGSGIWRSDDGGDHWVELTRAEGLPRGTFGIIGVAVSPVDARRVYAIVEAADGGVFRSDDGGKRWQRTNDAPELRQRPWYYTRIYADPVDPDRVYVVNVQFWRSDDGGATFTAIQTPHADNHDLWIDPDDPRRMVEGNDGGACLSTDGGRTWSPIDNQPTGQFYRVTTDDSFPYRILAAQQDSTAIRIGSRSGRFEVTAGGESGHLSVDPKDDDVVYGGSYGGTLVRLNHRTGERRRVDPWPDNRMGHAAADVRYRFQWNFPIFHSRRPPYRLYAAANVLFASDDEGQSWRTVSPDLTRADPATLVSSGGPITQDNTGAEYHATIFAACESPHDAEVLWCGSDDGLVHVTRDGGGTWTNVTPTDLPQKTRINSIEAHPFEPGGLYVAATRYQVDDFEPYLFATVDYGRTWRRIDASLPRGAFTRVVRADPVRRGLLFAGTERGVHVSFDDGAAWRPLQLGLPVVPVTDLTIKDGDLVAATQGRALWVLDDLTPLREIDAIPADAVVHLHPPRLTLRGGDPLRVPFVLRALPAETEIAIEVHEPGGAIVRRFSTRPKAGEGRLDVRKGANRFEFDLRHRDADGLDGLVMWAATLRGPLLAPGFYEVRLVVGDRTWTRPFELGRNPRSAATVAQLREQTAFLLGLRDTLSEVHAAIRRIRAVRPQIEAVRARLVGDAAAALRAQCLDIERALNDVESGLHQPRIRSSQDALNHPIGLNNRIAALAATAAVGDNRPTAQMAAVRDALTLSIRPLLVVLDKTLTVDVAALEAALRAAGTPHVVVPAR